MRRRSGSQRALREIFCSDAVVEARFNGITADHGWSAANRAISLLRSIYCRPCDDHDGPRNPVDLWLARWRQVPPQGAAQDFRAGRCAAVLARQASEDEVNNPAIRDALWFDLYTGMRRNEVLTLRWE